MSELSENVITGSSSFARSLNSRVSNLLSPVKRSGPTLSRPSPSRGSLADSSQAAVAPSSGFQDSGSNSPELFNTVTSAVGMDKIGSFFSGGSQATASTSTVVASGANTSATVGTSGGAGAGGGAAAGAFAVAAIADVVFTMENIRKQHRIQMNLIKEEYGIAHEDLEGNANLTRFINGANEVDGIIDSIKEYERVKAVGPVQSQFFG